MMAHNLNRPFAIGSLFIMSAFALISEPHPEQELRFLAISFGSWINSVFPAIFHLQQDTTMCCNYIITMVHDSIGQENRINNAAAKVRAIAVCMSRSARSTSEVFGSAPFATST